MKAPVRYLLWIAGAIATLLVAGAIVLYLLYPKEKIIAAVTPRVEAALNREVALGDAGISIWPPFGVYLQNLQVRNHPDFTDEYLLTADYARASIRLWPLLTGALVFDDLELRGLSIYYEAADSVTSNVSDILAGESESPPLLIQKFLLADASLTYRDRTARQTLELQNIAAEFEVDVGAGTFEALVTLDRWSWDDASEQMGGEDAIGLRMNGSYQAETETVSIDALSGEVWSLPVNGSMAIDISGDRAVINAQMSLGPTDLGTMLQKLPESRRAAIGAYALSGDLSGQLAWSGAVGGAGALPISGELVWLRGGVASQDVELLRFDALSIPFDTLGFHVTGQDVILLGGPLQPGVVASGMPPEKYEITASGTVDLARVGEWTETPGMSGAAAYSVSARGRPDQLDRWPVKVRVEAEDIQFLQDGKAPLMLTQGVFDYNGEELRLSDVHAESGATRLKVRGTVKNIALDALLADSMAIEPAAELAIESPYCDIDAFFPDLAPDTAQPEVVSSQPPPLAATVHARLRADTVIVGGAKWNRVQGEVRYVNGVLTIDTLRGAVYGGAARMAGTIDLTNPDLPRYQVTARADSVQIDGALSRFTGLARHVKGRSNLSAEVDGRGTELADVLNQLTIDGTALLFDAHLIDMAPAAGVMGLLGLDAQESVPVRSRSNAFRVEQGRVSFEDFRFAAFGSDWSLTGSAGLDGTLDYNLAAVLSEELSAKVRLPDGVAERLNLSWLGDTQPLDLLKNDAGQVEIGFLLRGAYDRPRVELDWESMVPAMKTRFEARATNKLKEQVEDKAKEGLKGLLDKFKR